MTAIISKNGAFVRVVLITALILSVPLIAMRFTDEVNWGFADFAVAGALLVSAGLTFVWVAGKTGNIAYRAAIGVAVAAALLLVWIELAVGIISKV